MCTGTPEKHTDVYKFLSLRIKGVKLSSLGAVYVACSVSIHKDL